MPNDKIDCCSVCGEVIMLPTDFYRYGETNDGQDVICCELCESDEINNSAVCIPYGDYNFNVGEDYYFCPLFGAMDKDFKSLKHNLYVSKEERDRFPIEKMEWVDTNLHDGYYSLTYKKGFKNLDGITACMLDDFKDYKRFLDSFIEELAEENYTLEFPIWVVNLEGEKATTTDIVFMEENKKEIEAFLKDNHREFFKYFKAIL